MNSILAIWKSDAKLARAIRVLVAGTLGVLVNQWIDSGLGVSGLVDVFTDGIDMAARSGLIAALLILGFHGARRSAPS